jgi:predicted dehydrogenase
MPVERTYAVLGRGPWAVKMRSILEAGQRPVVSLEQTRKQPEESDDAHTARLAEALRASDAHAVWLCVPPGPHIPLMITAAIRAKLHAIAEKPWLCSAEETMCLSLAAQAAGVRLGVHFEYCLLDEMEAWRHRYHGAPGLRFSGEFTTSRPQRSDMPALENLGSHLLAMRRYAAPDSEIGELVCGYDGADARQVWLEHDFVDFLCNRQPIIQRFIKKFESAMEGADFPFGLDFASSVADDLAKWRDRQTAEFRRP